MSPSLIERVAGHPGVPMSLQQRRERFQGVIRLVISPEELALKRKHGRLIQERLRAAENYAIEAAATAEPVNPEYVNGI